MLCIILITYPLTLHIGEVKALHWHYLHHYWQFCILDTLQRYLCPFCDLCENLEYRNYFRSTWFVSLLLPFQIYYILVKLEHFNSIISIYIGNFMFLTPLQLHFVPTCDPWKVCQPINYWRSTWFVLFWLPIHLHYIFVKLKHFNDIICIIINDFVFWTPFSIICGPFVTFVRT